jgi:hypothetical protein
VIQEDEPVLSTSISTAEDDLDEDEVDDDLPVSPASSSYCSSYMWQTVTKMKCIYFRVHALCVCAHAFARACVCVGGGVGAHLYSADSVTWC